MQCRMCLNEFPRLRSRGLCVNCYALAWKRGTLEQFPKAEHGRPHTAESKAKIGTANLGKRRTPEERAKMSDAKRQQSDETKAKISASLKGHPGFWLGKKRSPEVGAKVAAAKRAAPKLERTFDASGYPMLYRPEHPRARGKSGRVPEHIIAAEEKIGRPLADNEIVHHMNGIKSDNRPDNLVVMTRADHQSHHRKASKGSIAELRAERDAMAAELERMREQLRSHESESPMPI